MRTFALALLALSSFASGSTLESPSYHFEVEQACPEGEVTCDNITGHVQRQGGDKQPLTGKTLHSLCADGVTPCRFLGYEVLAGGITYILGEDGQISILDKQGAALGSETGEWTW